MRLALTLFCALMLTGCLGAMMTGAQLVVGVGIDVAKRASRAPQDPTPAYVPAYIVDWGIEPSTWDGASTEPAPCPDWCVAARRSLVR